MTKTTNQLSESELENRLRAIMKRTDGIFTFAAAHGVVWDGGDLVPEMMAAFEDYTASAVKEAENAVIEKAHQPCECGQPHQATPVRSVQGNVTTYCQFSRVTLSKPEEKV